jgi:hypothetical protein
MLLWGGELFLLPFFAKTILNDTPDMPIVSKMVRLILKPTQFSPKLELFVSSVRPIHASRSNKQFWIQGVPAS